MSSFRFIIFMCVESHSVMSNSLQPHGLYSLWNFPGQSTGVGSLSLLQGIFSTQGSNLGLLHCRQSKDLLSMALPIRTRPSFSLSQSLPLGSFHKPLILLYQREDRMKTTVIENKPIRSHRLQSCLTQWNPEPCCVGPPKTDGSW